MAANLPPISWVLRKKDIEEIPAFCEAISRQGAHRLSAESGVVRACWENAAITEDLLKNCAACGLEIFDVHAPHGYADSLGCPIPGAEEVALNSVKNSVTLAAELGAKTVAVHTARTRFVAANSPNGVEYLSVDLPQAKERISRQLDELLPFAEKHGVILAVENLFLPSSTGEFLNTIIPAYKSPYLGYCYDSGHALLLEDQPGKNFADIPEWIRLGWEDNSVIAQGNQLDIMLENIVTCHLHDNDGLSDQHKLPGLGIINWQESVSKLRQAPRLISLQAEISSYDPAEVSLDEQFGSFTGKGFHF